MKTKQKIKEFNKKRKKGFIVGVVTVTLLASALTFHTIRDYKLFVKTAGESFSTQEKADTLDQLGNTEIKNYVRSVDGLIYEDRFIENGISYCLQAVRGKVGERNAIFENLYFVENEKFVETGKPTKIYFNYSQVLKDNTENKMNKFFDKIAGHVETEKGEYKEVFVATNVNRNKNGESFVDNADVICVVFNKKDIAKQVFIKNDLINDENKILESEFVEKLNLYLDDVENQYSLKSIYENNKTCETESLVKFENINVEFVKEGDNLVQLSLINENILQVKTYLKTEQENKFVFTETKADGKDYCSFVYIEDGKILFDFEKEILTKTVNGNIVKFEKNQDAVVLNNQTSVGNLTSGCTNIDLENILINEFEDAFVFDKNTVVVITEKDKDATKSILFNQFEK